MVTDASFSPASAAAACSTVSRFARVRASAGEDRSAIAFLDRCTRLTVLATDPEIALVTVPRSICDGCVDAGVARVQLCAPA